MIDLPKLDPALVTLHTSYKKHAPYTQIAHRVSICSCGLWLYHHSDGYQSARSALTYLPTDILIQYKPNILAHINHIKHDTTTAYMNTFPPIHPKDHTKGMDILTDFINSIKPPP